jgi:quinoprotein glucose dehydrogenase
VGPELAHLAEKQPADYLLESILFPNAKVAPGFESVLLTSGDGTLYGGVVKSENDQVIELNSPEDGLLKIKKTDIKTRVSGLSGMPEGIGNILSKQELRDWLAFLTSKR